MRVNKYCDYDFNLLNDELEINPSSLFARKVRSTIYATKTIESGNQFEVEIYPALTKNRMKFIRNESKEINRKWNDAKRKKNIIRKINHNFGSGDLYGTLTYPKECYPENMDEAKKNMVNFIKRIKTRLKKKNIELSEFKYVYATEKSEKGRIHHHFIMNSLLSMDEVMECWNNRGYNKISKIDYDAKFGITGLATYLCKEHKKRTKSEKRYSCSKNLENPIEHRDYKKFSERKVKKMASDEALIATFLEKEYPHAAFLDVNVSRNKYGHVFIHARMTKRRI